jgi:Leucine-rich repeat (LRR) protein
MGEILKEKKFTNGADKKFVASKYASTFCEVMHSVQVMHLVNMAWDDHKAKLISLCLKLCTSLEVLLLGQNAFTDCSVLMEAARECPSLTQLGLAHNRICNPSTGCPALASNSVLRELNLCENGISDICALCDALKINTTLTELHLNSNKIADLCPLEEMLQKNFSLKALFLNANLIVDVRPLGVGLHSNATLNSLFLKSNEISDITPITEAVKTNQDSVLETLAVDGNPLDSTSIEELHDTKASPLVSVKRVTGIGECVKFASECSLKG